MLVLQVFVLLCLLHTTLSALSAPAGVHFLGKGYNLLTANPEGAPGSRGGVDPGILDTRSVIKLTYDKNRMSDDRKYTIPDEVQYGPRQVCTESTRKDVISGAKSYQDTLKVGVDASYSSDALFGLTDVSFSMSSKFAQMKKETSSYKNLFYQARTECNYGTARIRVEAAGPERFTVSNSFKYAICALPTGDVRTDTTTKDAYMRFIDSWGTHVITKVTLGTRTIEKKKESESAFLNYINTQMSSSIKSGASYGGHSGSMAVDMEKVTENVRSGATFGSAYEKLTSGSKQSPEPVHLSVMSIDQAVSDSYFTGMKCTGMNSMSSVSSKLQTALSMYPAWKHATKPEDRTILFPVAWPKGTYGLVKTKSGCPKDGTWHSGWRRHDTEDDDSNNHWTQNNHFVQQFSKNNMNQHFCMKTNTIGYTDWPKGEYCILKKRDCPTGFQDGWIKWDDEDDNNGNSYGGVLPDGSFGRDTVIYYCCRKDGFSTNSIILPKTSPFYLVANSHNCQAVDGMRVAREYFRWDCEDDDNSNSQGGSHPWGVGGRDVVLNFCYYYR